MTLVFLLSVVLVLVPVGLFLWREHRLGTPSLHWPVLAPILHLEFSDKPPRMSGHWNGRAVVIETHGAGARVMMPLARPSRLRIEIGPKDEVTRRSGIVVPDPVQTGDHAFEERLLARCSDTGVGSQIVDPVLRQRLLAAPHVEILGQGDSVQWLIPAAREPDTLEHIMDVLTALAAEMERFPANA